MKPLLFEPLLKRIRWGGTRLGTLLGKPVGPEQDYAESWEVADHGDDQTRVASGELKGMSLRQLVQIYGAEILGRHIGRDQFPLLIKFLDAHDWLSLQVHPNDDQAVTYDPHENGKTEAWVILDAATDSRICAGLKHGVTAVQLREAIQTGAVEECLQIIGVKPGDCLFVPAGTVHALGPGIVLAEVQQQSDLTFRLHDWGRVGPDGTGRTLHLEESLACTNFDRGPISPVVPRRMFDEYHEFEELVRCQYFVIQRHRTDSRFRLDSADQFRILMVLSGNVRLFSEDFELRLKPGNTVLVPAACRWVQAEPEGTVTILEIFLP